MNNVLPRAGCIRWGMDGDDSKDAADSSILWLREIEQTDGEEGGGTEREGGRERKKRGEK